MNTIPAVCLALALSTASTIAMAQSESRPFNQPGPTGDNRAATGNPGTQAPPTASGKEAAKQKKPLRQDGTAPAKPQVGNAHSAGPTASPGTPAENSVQPESAK